MRWRFFDSSNHKEAADQSAVSAKIDAWWSEFQLKSDQLPARFAQETDWDLPEWMAAHLEAIHPHLLWEFGPAVRGDGHRLVITPETAHHLRPLVTTILKRAPRFEGWEFYGYRVPEDLAATLWTVQGRTGRDLSESQVRARRGEHHRIDLCYSLSSAAGKQDPDALHAAFVATESLLGEEKLDKWIGAIEVIPSAGKGLRSLLGLGAAGARHYIRLDQLKETVDALIGSIREQLPREPHYAWVDEARWSLWQLNPETEDDYCEQRDLLVGKSANPSFWMAARADGRFSSERFSQCGETFCYVKLDGSQEWDEEKFADKSEIEDALDQVLKPGKLGCQIGGGTGRRYSYIDLALVDLEAGIQAVRQRLQAGSVPRRAWIQFFDAELAAEWVGIYDDSPAPPLPFDE